MGIRVRIDCTHLLTSCTCKRRLNVAVLLMRPEKLRPHVHLSNDYPLFQTKFLCFVDQTLFGRGGIFIVPHMLWHGASVFPVSSEGLPHLVASYMYNS
jgi:hypothetical protein